MNNIGSSTENAGDDRFDDVARQIAEILSATGVTSCEMTLTMSNDSGAAKTETSTLFIEQEILELDEDIAPDAYGLGAAFVLFKVPEEDF